jgi:hypothetical protein
MTRIPRYVDRLHPNPRDSVNSELLAGPITLQRIDVSPVDNDLLNGYTIVGLVINKMIGSGIFTVPPKVLAGTRSVGGSLLVWTACGNICLCDCYCWLELGLNLPFRNVLEDGAVRKVSTPRSGGEKNFVRPNLHLPILIFLSPIFHHIRSCVLPEPGSITSCATIY